MQPQGIKKQPVVGAGSPRPNANVPNFPKYRNISLFEKRDEKPVPYDNPPAHFRQGQAPALQRTAQRN